MKLQGRGIGAAGSAPQDNFSTCHLPAEVDVLVVGCGPAGACAAMAAAQAKASVLAVDANPHIGSRPHCAEYIPAMLASQIELPDRAVVQRVGWMESVLMGESVRTQAPGFILDRAVFDHCLAEQAVQAGARLEAACKAVDFTGKVMTLRWAGKLFQVRASVVVAADGAGSFLRKAVTPQGVDRLVGVQVEVPLAHLKEETTIFFQPAWRHGYAWLFPKGPSANLGIGMRETQPGQAWALLEQLRQDLVACGILKEGILRRSVGAIAVASPLERLHVEAVLFAGDAAGLTHSITGAGIPQAVLSGLWAGRAAAEAAQGDAAGAFTAYEREVHEQFGAPLRRAYARRERMERLWGHEDFSRVIKQSWPAYAEYRND